MIHQQLDARIQGGLGQLDLPDISLRDDHALVTLVQHVRPGPVSGIRCGVRAAKEPSTTPSALMMPHKYISATASMIPEPQMPVTPNAAMEAANPGSSDHSSEPITLKRASSVAGSMRTRSIAPGAARWPQLICAPSKAGPVGLEQASKCSRFPSTISALVPMSTSSEISSSACGSSARIMAAASAPT